jgi:hypothetical protein
MCAAIPDLETVTRLVDALVKDRRVSVPVSELALRMGMSVDDLFELLGEGIEASAVDVWRREGRISVTLSPHSAEARGLKIAVDGRTWIPIGVREPTIIRRSTAATERVAMESELSGDDGLFRLDRLADPEARDPEFIAIDEETARGIRKDKEGGLSGLLPRIRVVLGIGRAWPVQSEGDRCSLCRGLKLNVTTYCPICDRSGMDHLLPRVSAQRPAPKAPKSDSKLKGGKGKAGAKGAKQKGIGILAQ